MNVYFLMVVSQLAREILVLHQQWESSITEDDTKTDISHLLAIPDEEEKETSITQQEQNSPTQPITHSTPVHYTARHNKVEEELNEFISRYNLTEDILKQVCDFVVIIQFIDWFKVGPRLPKIYWNDIRDIRKDGHDEGERRWLLMDRYRARNGKNATNEVMLRAMLESGMRSNAETLCEFIQHSQHTTLSLCDMFCIASVVIYVWMWSLCVSCMMLLYIIMPLR